VFYGAGSSVYVNSIPSSTAKAYVNLRSLTQPVEVALSSSGVVYVIGVDVDVHDEYVLAYPPGGPLKSYFAEGSDQLLGLRVDGTDLYYAQRSAATWTLVHMVVPAGDVTTIDTAGFVAIDDVAVDTDDVYSLGMDGRLRRVSRHDGSQTTLVASDPTSGEYDTDNRIALTSHTIYWTATYRGTHAVWSLPK
jgi:hypothetical protein